MVRERYDESRCVGCAPAFRAVIERLETIAARTCVVLLEGESGSGKELVAREIHRRSPRAGGPFVPVDCTNLSGELFASQLFGHVKGAFTGAEENTLGFFRAAEGGTLLLDEIGELPPAVQGRLLRVLQEYRVTPVGAAQSYPVDVRVICATNRDLEEMVRRGAFRRDLYYRINVISLRIPPLRERPEDVIPLAEYFLARQARQYNEPLKYLLPATKACLLRHSWPGNVRELANAMEHAVALSRDRVISPEALPASVRGAAGRGTSMLPTLDEVTRQVVQKALDHTDGHKMQAAALLGIERRRLNRLIERLGIELPVRAR